MPRQFIQVTNTLTAHSQRIMRVYRGMILRSMADYLNQVRLKAVHEIIPSKNTSNRTSYYRMYKTQPSTPGKLTERTGALIKMLKYLSTWQFRARSASMSGDAMMGSVKVTSTGTMIDETYQGTLSAYIRDNSKFQVYRSDKARTYLTKQQLFFRFMHETGLRGQKRPFIEPAAQKIKYSTEQLIQAKLNHLERLGVIKFV